MDNVALVKTENRNVVPTGSHKRGLLQNFFALNRADFPKHLLLTTFNMNPEFMEEYVYSQIPANCTTLIFYSPFRNDGGLACSSQGRKDIRFIRAKSTVFHPKFMLAISGQNILMGVSSANLTNGGWGGLNQEASHLFADVEHKYAGYSSIPRFSKEMAQFCEEYLKIIEEKELYPSLIRDKELLKRIQSLLSHKSTTIMSSGKISFMHNYKEPLFNQIRNSKICSSLKKIHIFSPVHFNSIASQFDEGDDKDQQSMDNDLFKDFKGFFKDQSKASIDFYSSDEVAKDIIKHKKFVTFYRNKHKGNSHLKAYIFESQKKVILVSGSANFSKSAWKRKPGSQGNAELMIMEDITKEWKGIQRELVGKSEKLEGVTVVEKGKFTKEGSFVTIIHQMDISRISMDEYRVMIYASPELKQMKRIILEYYESGDEQKRKTQPLNIRKNRNAFKARKRLLSLVKARPLFVSYRQEGRDITVFVNYDYDDLDDEVYSPIENEYRDLFSYFGFRWRRGGSNPIIIPKGRQQFDDPDDSEIRNNYQSVHDKFYHDWKKIFRTLDYYRNHKKYCLLYKNGLDMIDNFITRQKKMSKDDPERYLNDCHVQFLSEYLYEYYRKPVK